MASRVLVPDFEIYRQSGLVKSANLFEGDLSEGKCTFVLVTRHGHESPPAALIETDMHRTTGARLREN